MAQASFWWQQLVSQIPDSSLPEFKSRAFKWLSGRYFGSLGFWFLGLSAAIAMLFWHWKLCLATSVGVLVMWFVYRLQVWDWQLYRSKLRRIFGGANRQLTIAVGSGGLATLSSYMAISIGSDSNSAWIAVGAMLQGLGTLAILVLLLWHIFGRQAFRDEAKLDRMLAELTDTNPLKRLIAVRHLTRLGTKYDKGQQQTIADYFRIMLSQESEATIRDAVLDGLQAFDNLPQIAGGSRPFSIPADLNCSAKSRRII
ncbi:hypothetical protein H6S82_21275 [Planktothrix sp. FACHB-1355]|uniref:Armadillo-type fold-containing protein n=1 Tax=Aerosakkonema funiforme FACHB-1375 TaxID=2949571 RepID=A0A926VDF5_9CYAN|nr:hypothetical protein [Aerosakkonema funiforme]MBD2181831.1 hypothetical protein [Aerosakkonema funiforme FACHB-1375]MBD3561352.1 hypothetical protein [Planktothrix sp. FACHB-1355]